MRDMEDPPRLFESDDAPAELRVLLRRAHDDVASASEAQELVRSVESRMAAPAGSLAGRHRKRGHGGAVKLLTGLVLVGIGTGGYLAVRGRASDPPVAPGPPASDRQPGSAVPAATGGPGAIAPAPLPAVDPLQDAPAPAAAKAPRLVHARRNEHDTVHHRSVDVRSEPSSTERPPADEFALLRAARQAIAEHPARALSLTDQHARLFPQGMLAQEREAIAIEALAQLGRGSQAQARAHAFLTAHPDSPYRGRIETSLRRTARPQPSP